MIRGSWLRFSDDGGSGSYDWPQIRNWPTGFRVAACGNCGGDVSVLHEVVVDPPVERRRSHHFTAGCCFGRPRPRL
jgi:hypothetical protein